MPNPADSAWVGRQIDTRYVIESELGGGGMGVVLRGRHRFTGAAVAIKMMRADLQIDPGLQERFLAEARAPAMIGHPGIVSVLDAGKMQSGELYLVMELLVGDPLRAFVGNGMLRRPDIRRIGAELLDALGAAHAKGFVHRDLKPENVFLEGPTRIVRLLDFGIAKTLAPDLTSPKTAAGVVLGTLLYMSPEQLRDPRSVDGRSDLWSVGVILYELLSGALPYRGSTGAELYTALATKEPEPIARVLPGVGPEIIAFFSRALSRDPKGRFASAAEMTAALNALPFDGTAVGTAPSPTIGVGATQWTLAGADPARAGSSVIAATMPPTGAGAAPAVAPLGTWPATPPLATPSPVAPPVGPTPSVATPMPPSPATPMPPSARPPPVAPTMVSPIVQQRTNARYIAYALFLIAAGLIIAGLAVGLGGKKVAEAPPSKPPEPRPIKDGVVSIVLDAAVEPVPPPAPPDAPPADVKPPRDPKTPPATTPPATAPPATTPPVTTPPVTAPPATRPPVTTPPVTTPPVTAPPVTTPPVTTPPVTTPSPLHAACVAGCKVAHSCGLEPAGCVAGCESAPAQSTCVRAATDCNAVATCAFNVGCRGITPHGVSSCRQTMTCQDSCRGDTSCGCQCVAPMAASHAFVLWMLDACASVCAGGTDHTCIALKCSGFVNQCNAQ